MKWLRRSHGEMTGHPLPAQPTIVAIHLHRPGDLAAAEHCLSGRVSKVYVMSGRRMERTQAHAEALRHLCEGSVVLMACLLYTSPSPRDKRQSRMPSSA